MSNLLNRTNGIIGTVVGLILAIVGIYFFAAGSHHKIGLGLLVVGIIVLAFGVYAYMTSMRAKSRAA